MEYQRRGKKRVEPSTEAQREPSPTHSDAHTPHDDSTSGQQNAQARVGAQTPPRQTPPVDQQALLLTMLQTLTSLVQSMAGNQRSQASPTGDTTAPPKEKATTVSFHHFMSMQPPRFTGDGSPDKAKEWIEEVERIFEVLEARNRKMQEFLDLQQNHLSLEEYVAKYRHLEAYFPHLYTTAEARADKFIYGLREGLRGRVMSSKSRNLDEAVTMARRMEEDWARTQRDHQKKTSQHTQGGRMPVKHQHPTGRARPYERRDDRTFRRNRPGRSETTQGSVASPTSSRCPTCSYVHPGKSCYRATGACLHCGVKKKKVTAASMTVAATAVAAATVAARGTATSRPQMKTTLYGLAKFFKDVIDVRIDVMIDMNVYVVACALPWAMMQMDEIEDSSTRTMRGQWDVAMSLGDVPFLPLVSPVRAQAVQGPRSPTRGLFSLAFPSFLSSISWVLTTSAEKKKTKVVQAVAGPAAVEVATAAAWMRGQWDVAMCLGDVPLSPLVSPVRSAGGARPQGTVVCCAWSVGSRLPKLGVLGKVEYLSLEFTHPGLSALPLQRMKWIHTVMGHHRVVSRL
ncbi:hypothetical protein EJ110_NYTH43006 [Nymphaea thermarum]|nr:hypothetical protein EJ110_NYTH43006 [Nymphaea thermarum]